MTLTNEMLTNGIWIKDLEAEARGWESEWEFREDCYLEGNTIMVMGDYMCSVADYGTGWIF